MSDEQTLFDAPKDEDKPKKKAAPRAPRATAEDMAKEQRSISVSEFFTKNRHLLGFDNPRKSLMTAVKEAVDNSLDACEEAGILPSLRVEIRQWTSRDDRYTMIVEDNGPGIVAKQVPKIFGKLLYGSKFHRLKMSRGQQGIGISAAGMYGTLTTGQPVRVTSRTSPHRNPVYFELQLNTQTNEPMVSNGDGNGEKVDWERDGEIIPHGTCIEIDMEAKYQRGRLSVDAYLEQTMISNPHIELFYKSPNADEIHYERATETPPHDAREIKPHPYGVELGVLLKMLHETEAVTLQQFLGTAFCRIGPKLAKDICEKAELNPRMKPHDAAAGDADTLFQAINTTRIIAPPTDCVAPIGEELLLKGLQAQVEAEFYTTITRKPSVYRGNPFLVEVGLAYGGNLSGDDSAQVIRFANRVPLLYQPAACATTRSIIATKWKNYGFQQPRGALPVGPLMIIVHVASVWVPFTNESKEAVANYPEIEGEIQLALKDAGRKIGIFIRARKKEREEGRKRGYVNDFIPLISESLQELCGFDESEEGKIREQMTDLLEAPKS